MIKGELTNLVAVERSDSGTLFVWFNDPDLMRSWGFTNAALSLNAIQTRIENWLSKELVHEFPVAHVVQNLEGTSVGFIEVSGVDRKHGRCELSVFIADTVHRDRGYGGDALETLIDTLFNGWGFHRLIVRSEAFNTRAHTFFERLGFQRDAVLRDARFMDGLFQDVHLFSVLDRDWQAMHE